jgi:hypothetical protein
MTKYLNLADKLQKLEKSGKITQDEKFNVINDILYNQKFIKWCKNKKDWTYEEHDQLMYLLDLPKDSGGYYLNRFNERTAYNGIRDLKRSYTEFPLSPVHLNEIQKATSDYYYFRKYYIKIVTRNGIQRPEPREYQERLEESFLKLEDTIVLFPRQSGKTVTAGVYLLFRGLSKENINIGIVANKRSGAAEVLDKIKKIYIELPIWLQKGILRWNTGDIEFDNGTRIMTDAPSSDSFRGFTINIVYIDEAAYIPKKDWDAFSDAVFPTMNSLSFKQTIITSTANGINHFSDLVKQAKMPNSEYQFVTCSWKEVPRVDKQGNIIPPKKYKEQVIKKYGLKYFLQTEANEFLGSSDTLVDGVTLKRLQDHIEQIDYDSLPSSIFDGLNVYKKPENGHSYICSVDSSKDGIDDFSINVIDITKFPFEQVADANLQVDYLVMPEYLDELGKLYNNALMIIENNEGSGQSISDTLWNIYNYENMYRDKNTEGRVGFKRYTGFRTTPKSRSVILGLLKAFLEENKLIINSKTSLQQLYTFVKNDSGKYQAQDGYKDDNVMSLAIAFAPFMESKVFDDYELFIKELRTDSGVKTKEFMSVLDLSFDDDGEDYETEYQKTKRMLEDSGDISVFDEYGIPESNAENLRNLW